MPERSALTQGVQIGVESTPGTSVAANKKLNSIGFGPAVNMEPMRYRAMGNKFATVVTPGKEWVEFDVEGVGSYSELMYAFASLVKDPGAPVQQGATTAYKTTYVPATSAEDTVKTYTVEQGGAVRAHKFTYGILTELEIDMSRDGIELSGSGMGQRLSDNIALTGSPTSIEEKPILPTDLDVFLDATSGGLGTTKLLRVLNVTWHFGDRFAPVWVLNTANNSFVAHVETEPSTTVTLLMEADAEGMTQLTQMRAGSTKFMRIKATSPDLAGTAIPYSLTMDQAVKVSEPGDFSEEDGLYAIEWTFEVVHDGAWGKAFQIDLINKQTAF